MIYNLSDIGITENDLNKSTIKDNIKVIFDAMDTGSELSLHIKEDGNLANICPETRGTFYINKIDATIATLQFNSRVTGKFYSATFVNDPIIFSGWIGALSKEEEDTDDLPLENRVSKIENTIGDITLMDHYGGTIIDVLNKYTRQVLVDSSPTPNKIVLTNYYGNIQDISYNTPITVQVNNNSVDWTPGEDPEPVVEFRKDIYEDGQYVETITKTYPLKIVDLSGNWDSYREIGLGDMTKNVFYNLIKRDIFLTPGDPSSLTECFVLLAQSVESEIQSIANRIRNLENYFENNTFNIHQILANAVTTSSLTTNGNANITENLTVDGLVTFNDTRPIEAKGGINASGTSNFYKINIDNSLNLSQATVTLKSNPQGSDLINKTYVDNKAAATKAEVMANFKVGTSSPPSTGTPGTFYFQLKS